MEEKQRIQELEEQLSVALEASVEALKEKDIFLSTISHEVRTPLNAIVGITHLLSQESNLAGDERIKILKFSAENLLSLFTDLLEISKIEAGKLKLNYSYFHLFDLVSGIFSSLEFLAAQKKLQFRLFFDSKISPMVLGDKVRLSQVLNNLLSNAIKFTEHGGINLKVELVKSETNHQLIKFTITDTGIGIDEDLQKKVFDYFFQGLRTEALSGAGLGLGISQSLIKLMGSQIRLSSIPGQGSEFSFELKMETSQLPTAQLSGKNEMNLNGCKILVAEDHKASQFIIKGFLTKWRAKVTLAENGVKAVEVALSENFDIIIMDLQMPVMDGYQATAAIRTRCGEHYLKVPIIALTAMTVSEVKDKVLSQGFDDILSKPFQPEELYNKLEKYLRDFKPLRINTKIENIDFNTLRNYILSFFSNFKHIEVFSKQFSLDIQKLKQNYAQTIQNRNESELNALTLVLNPVLKWLEIKPLLDELHRGRILIADENSPVAMEDNIEKVEYYCQQLLEFLRNETLTLGS